MNLTDLLPNTTYIVRAYATNGAGTAYGEEKTFTTLEEPPAFPDGAIDSKFTVNAYNGQVYFSQGNLQYIGSAADPYWKFAEYQWEYIGNSQANTAQDIDRDLFCWGTSGYNHGANHYQPWSCGGSNSDYYAYGDMAYHLYDQTGQADWGYNAISNGGNEENMGWRTLSQAEWLYLFNIRSTTSGIRFARAQVNGVGGAILLPDDWDATIYGLNDVNNLGASMSSNIITADVWADTFEANGAVFLPIAGWMAIWDNYTFYSNPGAYWSSTAMNSSTAWYFDVYESGIEFNDNHDRGHKRSVRLAMNAAPVKPTVTTLNPTRITDTTAIAKGRITDYGGALATECGICYRTEGGTETCVASQETGSTFSVALQDLTPNTTYIVRAYATNEAGTGYGEEVTFTTLAEAPTLVGYLDGRFSINADGGQVHFSQGNLQYIGSAAEPYWKFADYQWGYIGSSQANAAQNTDRDLFGWGTSGYDHGANCYQPWSTSQNISDYYLYGQSTCNLYDQTGQADWGYNAITNGGNIEDIGWRTLTSSEWSYIFETRAASTVNGTANARYAKAKVANVQGMILFPDEYVHPDEVAQPIGINEGWGSTGWYGNNYSEEAFSLMEANGAVFLPVAGYRSGTTLYDVTGGLYWSSSYYYNEKEYTVYFNSGSLYTPGADYRYWGCSVRLVLDAAIAPPTVTTLNVTGITNTTAIVGGRITDYGGTLATECGICYRTEGGTETCVASQETGSTFSVALQDLTPNTTYIVRAYATNEAGTSYGEEMTFTTLEEAPAIIGYIDGLFTVNAEGGQVYFSQGNLQYIGSATEPYWKFADYQWEYFGENGQGSDSPTVDRDLFGWGTSGYNHGAVCYQPWSTSQNTSDYNAYGQSSYNLYDQTGQADWGYNIIANGGNIENFGWRTLTNSEWNYVFETRVASTVNGVANARFAKAKVAGVQGVILFPDIYTHPGGVTQPIGINDTGSTGWYGNNYTQADFTLMELNGAVFLPSTGYRVGTTLYYVGSSGGYWTSSSSGSDAHNVYFYDGYIYRPGVDVRGNSFGVRLVLNAE